MLKKPILYLFLVFATLPLLAAWLYAILYSFGVIGLLSDGFTVQHWLSVINSGELLNAILYSVYLASVEIIISLLLALVFAYLLPNKINRGVLYNSFHLPLLIASIVVGFVFFMLLSNSGLLARLVYQLGFIKNIESFPNIINDQLGIGIIISHVFLAFPFFILMFNNTINEHKVRLLQQLSASLGATKWQQFRYIGLPILLHKNKSMILLYFVFMLGSYEIPLLLGSQSARVISVLTIDKLLKFDLLDKPQAFAIASAYTFLVVLFTFFVLQKNKHEVIT